MRDSLEAMLQVQHNQNKQKIQELSIIKEFNLKNLMMIKESNFTGTS